MSVKTGSSFYRVPKDSSLIAWKACVPRDISTHRDMVKGTFPIYQSTRCHCCQSTVSYVMLHKPHVRDTVSRQWYKVCAKFPCHVNSLKHYGNCIYQYKINLVNIVHLCKRRSEVSFFTIQTFPGTTKCGNVCAAVRI